MTCNSAVPTVQHLLCLLAGHQHHRLPGSGCFASGCSCSCPIQLAPPHSALLCLQGLKSKPAPAPEKAGAEAERQQGAQPAAAGEQQQQGKDDAGG